MSEIAKLKQRLSNVGKNTSVYTMTVKEAKNLLLEIEELEEGILPEKENTSAVNTTSKVANNIPDTPAPIVQVTHIIMDGGTF